MFYIEIEKQYIDKVDKLAEEFAAKYDKCAYKRKGDYERCHSQRIDMYRSMAVYLYLLCTDGDIKKLIKIDTALRISSLYKCI